MQLNRRSVLRQGVALGILGLATFALPAARADSLVPAGTVVPLEFQQAVSSKTAKKGDLLKLRVYTDVVVNGKTLIRQDAPATGVVESVKHPGIFGKRAQLKVRLTSVKDVNGKLVPLDPYNSGDRFQAGGPGAAGAGLLVLGPVGLVGGAFVKGNNVSITEGTRIQAKVAGADKPNTPVNKDETPPTTF